MKYNHQKTNSMKLMRFRLITMIVTLTMVGAYGQKQNKTFSEEFNVNAETVLDINTSNADIEFETWEKNQIQVEAIIEIEGATAEQSKSYFEKNAIEIVGNSEKVKISTGSDFSWSFTHSMDALNDLNISFPDMHFEMPEMPEMPELSELPEMIEVESMLMDLSDMPVPPVPAVEFDYEAYEKDGEKYLKKWQKKFDKGFDEEYQKKMENWNAKMQVKREVMEKRMEEMQEKRQLMQEKRIAAQEKRVEKQSLLMEKRAAEMEKRMEKRMEEREQQRERLEEERKKHGNKSNSFYFSNDGERKEFKVKKTIKIKMPKDTKIKMNVRHGEVKLAENTNNLNAKLSYAALIANTIDGEQTSIQTSYSPVSVQKWNYGLLRTDYSEKVNLKEVLDLRLSATSSDVTVEKLLKRMVVNNKMGLLTIKSISEDFKEIDVSLQHAEFQGILPATAFLIEVDGVGSKLTAPASLTLDRTKDNNNTFHKGFNINKNGDKSIVIDSKYSEVVLKE